ncbi:MAG: hypothetical protein SFV51_20155 [Bryobacteraceae bacterium]|nr:hypothetical protein [Bryobacteraceae bacterium]
MNHEQTETKAASSGIVTKILLGGALAGAFGGWYHQSNQVEKVREELSGTRQQMAAMHDKVDASVSMAKAEANESIAKMNEEVAKARRAAQAQVAQATRAQSVAHKQTQEALTLLTSRNEALAEELNHYKSESAEKSTKVEETITGIKGEVGEVKTEVATTKTELEKTIAELKRVNGDMGVMSDRIATNGSELQALRRLGERDYYEFTLTKGKAAQRVGNVQLTLKKSDTKRNRFTMDVLADDRKVEKKDKGVNEPVQFYTSAAKIPYEIVINQVSKNTVTGYLAVPKVTVASLRK